MPPEVVTEETSEESTENFEYTKNFLSKVIFAIDTPSFQENFDVYEYRKKIKDRFPIIQEQKNPLVSLHIGEDKKVDSKFDEKSSWMFFSKDKTKIVSLNDSRIAVEFLRYSNFDEFFLDVSFLLDKLFEMIPNFFTMRVGLRYINEIKFQDKPGVLNWRDCIVDSLTKSLDFIDSRDQSLLKMVSRLEIKSDNYKMTFQFGIPNSVYPNEAIRKEFTLDYDVYNEESSEKEEILGQLRSFHDIIKKSFEESIKDKLRKEMGARV